VAFQVAFKKHPFDIYRTIGSFYAIEDALKSVSKGFVESKNISKSRHRWMLNKFTKEGSSIVIISEDLRQIEASRYSIGKVRKPFK
jgi:hypothetical protein